MRLSQRMDGHPSTTSPFGTWWITSTQGRVTWWTSQLVPSGAFSEGSDMVGEGPPPHNNSSTQPQKKSHATVSAPGATSIAYLLLNALWTFFLIAKHLHLRLCPTIKAVRISLAFLPRPADLTLPNPLIIQQEASCVHSTSALKYTRYRTVPDVRPYGRESSPQRNILSKLWSFCGFVVSHRTIFMRSTITAIML